jgi:pyruvate/2-oxoacid:ferredoxin oxidoreductase alpha subunit
LRPITLFPFPSERIRKLSKTVRKFLAVECSNGQMIDDVKLALNGNSPVEFYGRMGGEVPSSEEVFSAIERLYN